MKMTNTHRHLCAFSLSLATAAFGGETDYAELPVEDTAPPLISNGPDALEWIKLSGDFRLRGEYRDVDAANGNGPDPSTALTIRGRLGLTLGEFHGFSAFGEVEATGALVDDYTAGGGNTYPNTPNQTPIADPQNIELNRAWLQYKKDGILAKVGRQRIIRNDAFHIGNVGWRQNEQTYDAAQIAYTGDNFSISYAYSNAARRIFGEGAGGANNALEEFTGDFHFIDGTFTTPIGKVGAYAYLIDVDNQGNVGESNTYGLFTNLGPVYLEAAYQDGSSAAGVNGDGDYDAFMARANYTLKTDIGAFKAGIDYTEGGYKTPFQTAHAFFGFADAFLAQQIGLNNAGGNYDGIFDGYLMYTKTGLPGGLTFKGWLHYFADSDLGQTYGYEADAVLVKKFSDSMTGLIKAAYFVADDSSGYGDISQVTVDLSYKF